MLVAELYTQRNITRNDFIRQQYWPKNYLCNSLPVVGQDRLQKYPQFNIAAHHYAAFFYMTIRKNPRYILYLVRDTEQYNKYVGFCTYILPEYVPNAPSHGRNKWVYTLQNWLLTVYFNLKDIWMFKSFRDVLNPPELRAEWDYSYREMEALATPEILDKLKHMSRNELTKWYYPKSLAYYMNFFGVTYSDQGKGTGGKILATCETAFKSDFGFIEPPVIRGPAKIEMFSSPAALKFYKRCGYTVGAKLESTLSTGANLTHTLFYKNIT